MKNRSSLAKRAGALLLAAMMAVTALPASAMTAYAEEYTEAERIALEESVVQKATTYRIYYNNISGVTNSPENPTSYTSDDVNGKAYTLNLKAPSAKKGYTFKGWYDASKDGNLVTEIPAGSAKAINLYAQWTANTYNITYEGCNDATDPVKNPNPDTFTYDTTLTLKDPTRDHYTFNGWYEFVTGDKISSVKGYDVDITLTAKWTPKTYMVKYDLDSGTNDSANPSSYVYGSEDIVLKDPKKTGSVFMGWFEKDGNQVSSIPKHSAKDYMLYAHWDTDPLKLTYKLQDSTAAPADNSANPKTFTYGKTVTLKAPTRDHYTFDGWFEKVTGKQVTSTSGLKSDTILYAKWTPKTYKITYVLNGGTNDASNPAQYTIESADIKLQNPKKDKMKFLGWYDASFGGTKYSTVKGTTGKDITLYARWDTPDNYTITYVLDGGTNNAKNYSNYSSVDAVPLFDATRAGYTFLGWYDAAKEGNKIEQFPLGTTGNKTLYARWKGENSYSIKYELDGGKNHANNPSSYTVTDYIALDNPTKTGYKFLGWYDAATGGNKITEIPKGSTGKKTLYARWAAATSFTITYKLDGGKNNVGNPDKYDSDEHVIFADPTKSGYRFLGWYDAATGGKKYTEFPKGTTGNKTLYARWLQNGSYYITYELNGGKNNADNPDTYNTNAALTLKDPTKSGCAFAGWYDKATGGKKITKIAKGSTGNMTFYARWNSIKYVLNGGKNDPANPATYTGEKAITIKNPPARTGYTFKGWFTENKGGTQVKTIAKGSTGEITLYARWEAIKYDINYVISDEKAMNDGNNPATYTYDDEVVFKDAVKPGYAFLGWYDKASGGSKVTKIAKGSTGARTIYARFDTKYANYKITYVLDGGKNDPHNPTTYMIADTFKLYDASGKSGYTFAGWYTSASGGKKLTEHAKWSYGDKTYYARWTPNGYTITYNLNGGKNNKNNPATYNTATEVKFADPTRAGYKFTGWYNASTGGKKVTGISKGSSGNKVFYARWSDPITYTITYNLDGGKNNKNNPTTYKVNTATIKLADATKSGLAFAGWYDAAKGGNKVKSIEKGSTGNKTLYARWTSNKYTITYNLDGGKNNKNNPATYTKTDSILFYNPTRSGYVFKGWYDAAKGGKKVTGIDEGTTGNKTLYARWQNAGDRTSDRIEGANRYGTAVNISRKGWTTSNTVVIASGENYPDALAGASLAKVKNAPIILTSKAALSTISLNEILRLGATNAIILGGTAAVSADVENTLKQYGVSVTRIGGANRNATAADISANVASKCDTVYLVSNNSYPDALSISSVAAVTGAPILYMNADGTVPAETGAAITRLGAKKGYIVGGYSAVGTYAEGSLSQLGLDVERIYGADRYSTSQAVYDKFSGKFSAGSMAVATGSNYPDALAGAAFAAKNKIPVLLVNSGSVKNVKSRITKSQILKIYVFGGASAVSESIEDSLVK